MTEQNNTIELVEQQDSRADALASVVLVLTFVAACIFWVANQ